MDAVAMQTEIKAVIDILNDVKKSKDVSRLDSAIDRLLKLQKAVKTGQRLVAKTGPESSFHKNDVF